MANLLFKMGEYKNLATTAKKAGTVYITKDEQSMYVDISDTQRIKIQGTVAAYSTLTDFNSSVQPPYSSDVIYFIAEKNALVRYDGSNWIQLNTTAQDTNTAIENLTKLIESNAEDIKALEDTTKDHETRVKTLEGEMDTAQADILAVAGRATALEGRMTTAESDIDKVEGRATSLEGRMTTAEGDISDLEEIAENHGTRIGSLESRMTTAEGDIDKVEGRATALEGRASTIESTIGTDSDSATNKTLKGYINDLRSRMSTAETDIGNLEDSLGNFKTEVGNTYVTKSTYNTKMGELDNSISNINTAIGTDSTPNSIKGRITAVEGRAGSLETRMGTAETDIGNLEDGLEEVNATIGTDNDSASNGTLKGYIRDLRTRVSTNETNITNVTNKANTNASDITSLKSRATNLESRMTTAETDIKNLSDYVDDTFATKTELETVESNLTDKIDDEIRAANAMTYKEGVAASSDLPVIADGVKVGDTYVVTKAFGSYQPGDLLVAKGTESETTGLITSNLAWDRVETGYSQELEPELSVVDNTIQLKSYTDADLGAVLLTSSAPNLIITTNANTGTINFSMEWGAF